MGTGTQNQNHKTSVEWTSKADRDEVEVEVEEEGKEDEEEEEEEAEDEEKVKEKRDWTSEQKWLERWDSRGDASSANPFVPLLVRACVQAFVGCVLLILGTVVGQLDSFDSRWALDMRHHHS